MKKLFVLLILLLSFGRSQAADIAGGSGIWGGEGGGVQRWAYLNVAECYCIPLGMHFHVGMIGEFIYLCPYMRLSTYR